MKKKNPNPNPHQEQSAVPVFVVPESKLVQFDLLRNKITFNLTDAYKTKLNINSAVKTKMLKPMRDEL